MVEAKQLHVVAALRPSMFAIGPKMNACMCLVFDCLLLCFQTSVWKCDLNCLLLMASFVVCFDLCLS